MESPTEQVQLRPQAQNSASNPPVCAKLNLAIDWRETGWFLEREEDDLAGYLFTQDCEVRKGSA